MHFSVDFFKKLQFRVHFWHQASKGPLIAADCTDNPYKLSSMNYELQMITKIQVTEKMNLIGIWKLQRAQKLFVVNQKIWKEMLKMLDGFTCYGAHLRA